MEPHSELLAALVSSHPGTRLELTIASLVHDGIVVFVVVMRSVNDPNGIVVGKGFTRAGALLDAEACLQGALDSVDVAVLKGRP